jgi:hypothetical protein
VEREDRTGLELFRALALELSRITARATPPAEGGGMVSTVSPR